MPRVFLLRICLMLMTGTVLCPGAVAQDVPSNYVPLDRIDSVVTPARQPAVAATVQAHAPNDPQEVDPDDSIQDEPLAGVTATSNAITPPEGAIVALGSDPRNPQLVRAYTSKNYPGVSRAAVQQVRDTQAQYGESLASEDVINILGRPFSEITQGYAQCVGGQSGEITTFYYLLREGPAPRSMAVVRFCADGMQGIGVQSLR